MATTLRLAEVAWIGAVADGIVGPTFFTVDEEHRRATNFYVWDSRDAAEEFFSDALRERVTGLYGVAPTIDFVEIAAIVDTRRSRWP